MKMLRITKWVTSEYYHINRFDWLLSKIALTALKYEIPMFQEFRTQNRTHAYSITVLFPIWVYVYALFY